MHGLNFVCFVFVLRAESTSKQYRLAQQDQVAVRKERRQMVRTQVTLEQHRRKAEKVQEFRKAANTAQSLAHTAVSEKNILEEEVLKFSDRFLSMSFTFPFIVIVIVIHYR